MEHTFDNLCALASSEDVWVITNESLYNKIADQMPRLKAENILVEPIARNTAPACALLAFILETYQPETIMGVFPSDHVLNNTKRFTAVIRAGIQVAAAGSNIVVLGIPPTRPETGYGYIEKGVALENVGDVSVCRVKHFREKPDRNTAEAFLASGNFVWNSGIFLWSARTLADAIREHAPDMAPILERIAASYGSPEFASVFKTEYPRCEGISIDYAVMERRAAKGEPRSNIYCVRADFGWSDLGSWASLHEDLGGDEYANVVDGIMSDSVAIESSGNYVFAPGKMVALVGVQGLVVVETEDTLLITTLERSQEVS
jgi:mannose-1-phosphate guanylyltransferase